MNVSMETYVNIIQFKTQTFTSTLKFLLHITYLLTKLFVTNYFAFQCTDHLGYNVQVIQVTYMCICTCLYVCPHTHIWAKHIYPFTYMNHNFTL